MSSKFQIDSDTPSPPVGREELYLNGIKKLEEKWLRSENLEDTVVPF